MVAINYKKTAAGNATSENSRIWFAPNRRVKTPSAASRAEDVCARIRSGEPLPKDWDEQDLFRALHTCAYRATRRVVKRRQTADDTHEWAQRWETVRDYIVQQNMPLVYSMIGRFDTRGLDRDDVLSEAMFALVQAAERFDPWRGCRFSTYACHAIHRAMLRSSKSTSSYRRLFPVQHDASFERPGEPENPDGLYVERLQRALDDNLGELTDLESTILCQRFPVERERRRLTLQQVGRVVGLSKERVRQIQNQALSKLRAVLEADPVLQ
jgi:RNA polymerase sigma factor (sigma-70 family)